MSLLASQSIPRTRACFRRSTLLSPDVLLMHFSVLSLLDMVQEHDKGKKTSSKKALHTAILVEPPSSDTEASSSSSLTPENQQSQSSSPIAALAGFSSSSSAKSSNASNYVPSTSSSSSLALQHPSSSSIPPSKLASLPEETRSSPQLATFFSDNSKNITAQRYRQLAALKLRQRIEDLVYQVKPHILPSGTRKSMDILPALQACKLIHRQIVVDSRHGINPLTNIDEGIITILLSMADLNPTRESRAILQHVDLLDKHLELVHSLRQYPALNKWHEALPQTMEESYTSILSKEVFSILEQLQPGNLATVIAAVDQVEPLSDGVLEHALRVAQNLNEPALAIIAWASHSVIRKPILQREEIQHLLHAHLPIFSTFIWPGLLASLSLSHLQNQDQEEKHAKAIYAYEAIFEYIKIHTPSKRYMYETLLQTLMHLPVPPESAESPGKKREIESVVKHEELFKASHSFLLETLQGVLGSVGSDAPPLDHTYDISFQDNTWVMTQKAIEQVTGESIEPTVRPSPEALKTISRHSQALSALLIYAYRHLQSKEVGERLYETWILRGLRRRWDRLPSEESESPRLQTDKLKARKIASGFEKYLTLVQEVESIRIRGATLFRDDEAALQAINASLELIASHTGMEEYTPLPQSKKPISQLQARKNAALEQRRYRHWQADVLLRCTSISNAYVSAVLMYWCTTTDYSTCRYFIHHFFSMRNNLRPIQIQSPTGMMKLHSFEVDEIPPLGNEIPIELASERIKRLMSNSEIITTLLHAAQKMGNLSLAEKCWLVACEEEESRGQNWKLPPAAYTSILQAYADEAHRERKYTPDPSAIEKPKNFRKSIFVFPADVFD